MPDFFDYNPQTGVTRTFDWDGNKGQAHIRSSQDVAPLLDYTKELRNTKACDDPKRELRLWATIPPVVQIELRNKGIDLYSRDPSALKRMRQTIERDYPYLKTTDFKNG